MTPEGILKQEVAVWLAGAFPHPRHFRMNTGTIRKGSRFIHMHKEGTADFLVCPAYGMPKWIELKAIGQKTQRARQEAQAAFAEDVRRLGHRYEICESLSEVIAFLNG